MPSLVSSVQATSASAGAVVDLEYPVVNISSLTSTGANPIQYSTNGGSSWTTVDGGASASIGTVAAESFRLRKSVGGGIPDTFTLVFADQSSLTAEQMGAVQVLIAQGNGYEPTIGSAVTQRITVDEGSDADHAEIILTFNCGPAGDIAIASERLAAADSRADVVKTAITGATANGALLSFSLPNGLTSLYVARKGESAYTLAAGATVTAAQAVGALWSGTLSLRYATVNIGNSYVGAGSNKRYRDLIVTGYVGV